MIKVPPPHLAASSSSDSRVPIEVPPYNGAVPIQALPDLPAETTQATLARLEENIDTLAEKIDALAAMVQSLCIDSQTHPHQ